MKESQAGKELRSKDKSSRQSEAGETLGKRGGPARDQALSPQRKEEIARLGGKAKARKGK